MYGMFFDTYDTPVYRPPSEAASFILRVTRGCAHNNCTYCNMYRGVKFEKLSDEQIMRQIELARATDAEGVRRVFLADGDTLVQHTGRLQKIMAERPPIIGDSTNGYDNIFRGIIKCADCGSAMLAKVENKRKRNNVLDKTFYCCTKYRKFGKKACSAHNIEARTVHEVVLSDIQRHAGQALADRKAMVTEIAERLNVQLSSDREQQKKELRQYKQRVSEIENLYAKLYEDMTRKLITEKRFQMLSARYDSEQEELSAKIKELEKSAIADREQLSSIEQFAEQISGYAGITELNYKIVHQLIDKILISEPVEINGEKIQRLTIHYKFIGALETLE